MHLHFDEGISAVLPLKFFLLQSDNFNNICCCRFALISSSIKSIMISVTRLGDFLKLLVIKFPCKVAQTFGDFLGYFEAHCFYVKTALSTFWATFEKNWLFFNLNIWSH